MIKFRTLDGEAAGKGFGLLAMEPTFDLPLPFLVSSFMVVQILDSMALIIRERKKKFSESIFDWSVN